MTSQQDLDAVLVAAGIAALAINPGPPDDAALISLHTRYARLPQLGRECASLAALRLTREVVEDESAIEATSMRVLSLLAGFPAAAVYGAAERRWMGSGGMGKR